MQLTALIKHLLAGSILTSSVLFSMPAGAEDKLEISGFGRVIAGYLDDPNVKFEGYDNSLSFNQQSLIALQFDYHVTDQLGVTSQLLAHTNSERDSGVEWLYLSYTPSSDWLIKAGRMRTPFYHYSDVIDVGFAYPWISPPQQLYSAFLFNQYDGASVIRGFSIGEVSGSIEGYYGKFNGDTQFQDRRFATDINGLTGIVLNGLYHTNLRLRAAYVTADFRVDLAEITGFANQLRSLGFIDSADSLTMQGTFDIYQIGLAYDELDYNLASEWMKIESNTVLAPNIESYYVQGGWVLQPFTVHVTYADLSADTSAPARDIPFGVSPDLDQLYFGYQAIFSQIQAADLQSLTLGIRWDAAVNVAFKAEMTRYRGELGISTFEATGNREAYDGRANLYQFGMEFVF